MKKQKLTNRNEEKIKFNAFTLIELLAIIVILAIIAVITVPVILNIIENSKMGAAKDSAYGYKDSINKFYVGKLSTNSNYNMPDGEYTVDGTTGYLTSTTNGTLEIQVSGSIPSGAVELENNNIKQACLKFGDYAVSITNGVVGEAVKGSCNGTLIGTSSGEDTPNTTTAAQTILNENGETKGYLTEAELANETNKAGITKPVKIEHPAITENTATDSTIPALTSYRYMGADPDNWIYFNCESYEESAQNATNCELWRIISVENGQLKITTDNVIGSGPWDDGKVNHGSDFDNGQYNYVNDWATSDLNDFLNNKYLNNGVAINFTNGSKEIAVTSKTFLDSYYDGFTATTSGTTGKAHGLINPTTKNLIATSTWYLGGGDSSSITATQAYAMERGNGKYTGDSITRLTYVNSKVAIISPSDYGFASSECYRGDGQKNLYDYNDSTCTSSNWMHTSQITWLLSPRSVGSTYAWGLGNGGVIYYDSYITNYRGVRPSVYLISNIGITGSGTLSDPYKIIK